MKNRIFAEPCLICVEAVFFILAVKGHKTFVIHAVFAALSSCISSKVEHIPYMSCPKIGSVDNLFNDLLVVICLIFFRIVTLFRFRGVPVKCFTAVFADAYCLIRIFLVESIKPRTIHIYITAVPSEIVIVGKDIADMHIFIINTAHCYGSNGCRSCFVKRMGKAVKHFMIFNQCRVGAVHSYFI